jgi:ferredoxin
MKIVINKSCIGCGLCSEIEFPELFKLQNNPEVEGFNRAVLKGKVLPELEEKVKRAEEQCPTAAIETLQDLCK